MARGMTGRAVAVPDTQYGAPLLVLQKSFDTSAVSLDEMQFPVTLVDVVVHCEETNSSGTVKIQKVVSGTATDISSALVCDTNHEFSSCANADGAGAPATLDDAQIDLSKGNNWKLVPANNAKGTAYIYFVRR